MIHAFDGAFFVFATVAIMTEKVRGFFSIWVLFHDHSRITGLQGEGGGYLFCSSLPLPPASQTRRHYAGGYCRELTSAHK